MAASLVLALQIGVAIKMMDAYELEPAEFQVSTLEITPQPVLQIWPVPVPTVSPRPVDRARNRPSPRFVRSQKKTRQLEPGGVLARIAKCESGGSPTAVSPSGKYRGKYQFDRRTWASVGGSGDPAKASEAEQDRRAATLYRQRGAQPWPSCGRR